MGCAVRSEIGPLQFRVPLSKADRLGIETPTISSGDPKQGWPEDAMTITGIWPSAMNRPLMVRPMFPGSMRFLADDPASVPKLDDVLQNVENGRLSDAYLGTVQLQGKLLIRVQSNAHIKQMAAIGTIKPIGQSPTVALYGPVRLGFRFLRDALLDPQGGLLAGIHLHRGRVINPGDNDWEAFTLVGFLGGKYQPMLRAGDALANDDAEKLCMPEIVINSNRRFSLGVAVGWMRDPEKAPASVDDPNLEHIPVAAFLRHMAGRIRESFLAEDNVDALMSGIFENEKDSEPWVARLERDLRSIGFGALNGDAGLPLEQVIREFQIAAASPIAAIARAKDVTQEQLALRHFGDLQATSNVFVYTGPISGRANQSCRRAMQAWIKSGQRCPLLITAYRAADLDAKERPKAGAVPVHTDLWARKETTDRTLRMFAADFTRLESGRTLAADALELIGSYQRYGSTGGPNSLNPTPARRVAFSEVTPERLLGIEQSKLLAGLSATAPADDRALASTFKVVRAVSEMECFGYLDKINASDKAGISYGPFHWSMADAIESPQGTTELGGFAAYVRYLSNIGLVANADVFAPQGLAANLRMGGDARNTSGAAFQSQLCFLDDCNKPRPMDASGPRDMIPSWRSFYRWVAIGRRHDTIGLATWRMAIRRLHRLCTTPIVLAPASDGREADSVTIGNAFTSEVAMAQLLRWHVKSAGDVVTGSNAKEKAHDRIVKVYKEAAKIATPNSEPGWTTAIVRQLRVSLDAFIEGPGKVHAELAKHFDEIADAPWIDDEKEPPQVIPGDHSYSLHPKLRLLKKEGRSFLLAPLSGEP